jgi:hypothetical protein
MIFMKKLILSIYLLISIISAFSQDVNVTSSFDTSRIYIGDQVKFKITIDQPAGLKLNLPFYKDTLCKNIEIISGPVLDTLKTGGRIKISEKYLITSFDSGLYQVPPVIVEMKNENGLKRFYSDYSRLEVLRVKIAPADTTAKIYDIIKPYRAPVTVGEILPWILLVALIGILAWAIVRFIRKFIRPDTGTETVINPDPAHVIAFRELERLREEQLWQKGAIKTYYTRLTEILRQYLENRFRVFSLELTTDETLDSLIKTGFKKDGSYKLLKTVLTGADLVKFAKHIPEPTENESQYQKSWDFVFTTREIEVFTGEVDERNKEREENL